MMTGCVMHMFLTSNLLRHKKLTNHNDESFSKKQKESDDVISKTESWFSDFYFTDKCDAYFNFYY